ncbi:MAG: glycosyltransferase family 4 protein [Chloroflexi bacterium]|nr:glycosyltransferase family 4 protein [Chloroflexota bacterium]
MRFFFLARGGPHELEIRKMGYPLSVIPARSGYDLLMRWRLACQMRSFKPDVVHEHGVPPLIRPLIKWSGGAHLLSFDHGEAEINRRKGKPWLNKAKGLEYRLFCENVIVNSAANRDSVLKTYHLPPGRVQVVHLGVDLQRFQAGRRFNMSATPGQNLVLGYVGRLQSYDKGTDLLPRLARQLADDGLTRFTLRIIGDGPDRQSLLDAADRLRIGDHLEFLGLRDDVPELMAGMDMLVVPSRLEAFGLVALEALAMGSRVVACHVDALTEVLADCPDARLVPPEDVPAMARAVLDLWHRYGKDRSLAGPAYVAKCFDARRMTADMERLYLSAMGQS